VIAQLKAELLKVRSTRTTLGLVLGMLALILLFSLLTGLLSSVSSLSTAHNQRDTLGIGGLAELFAALAGVLLVTSEFRFGTIRPTFLFNPDRVQVMLDKVIAGALSGLIFGVVGEALGFLIGYVIIDARGIPFAMSGAGVIGLFLGTLAAVALAGAIGVGIGAVVRNQVGAMITLLAWQFIVSPLLFGLVPSIGRYMPSYAQDALVGVSQQHLVSPGLGGLLLVGWALLLGGAGTALVVSRDVS